VVKLGKAWSQSGCDRGVAQLWPIADMRSQDAINFLDARS
jgi:hypothetical protein